MAPEKDTAVKQTAAKDAIQLDTSELDADQAFAAALDIIAVGNVRKT